MSNKDMEMNVRQLSADVATLRAQCSIISTKVAELDAANIRHIQSMIRQNEQTGALIQVIEKIIK